MKRFLTGLFLATTLMWLNVAAVYSADDNPKEIIKRVKKKYQELRSLKADFVQEYVWELAGETRTVQGVLYLKTGNKYRIETENEIIVTNGETVWTYSKANGQVIIDHLQSSEENPLPKDLLFQYSEEYMPHFVAEERLGDRKAYHLNLVPKDEEAFVKGMQIWVDAKSWLTIKVQQVDINDNVNTYLVQNAQENLELEDGLFKFRIPAQTEVVDLR